MKQPVVKLIEILNENGLESKVGADIADYLKNVGCCAFCDNKAQYDPCEDVELASRDFRVFPCDGCCSHFRDKRIYDDRYKAPYGTLADFYKDVVTDL